ncbi:MAG: sugar transferase [Deltaproteobacteria bacterium]|nr:sugar transferase [Deltaproteobacteria bacterium]
MLRERSTLIGRLHQGLDIILTAAAFISAYYIKRDLLPAPLGGLTDEPDYYIVLFLIIIISYLSFAYFGLYEPYRKQRLSSILWQMFKAVTVELIILLTVMYVLRIFKVSRLLLILFYLLDLGALAFTKSAVYMILKRYRSRGFNTRNLLIVGSKTMAQSLIHNIISERGTGYRIIGCLELSDDFVGKHVTDDVYVIDTVQNIQEVLLKTIIDEVVFAMPMRKLDDPRLHIIAAEELGVAVTLVQDLERMTYRPIKGRIQMQPYFGTYAIRLSSMIRNPDSLMIKDIMDFAAAAIGLVILSPLFILIAAAIKMSSRGPVFYKQERSGLHGRKFVLYKFRTMVADAEKKRQGLEALNEADGPVFKIRKDPRIIPYVGQFLRKTSLDELPQLINVLRGEMSLVGPRPPIPEEVAQYKPIQRRRLSLKPGLTCIWQTAPNRNDISFDDWMKLDLEYIDNWDLMLDMRLLLKTLKVVLLGHGR